MSNTVQTTPTLIVERIAAGLRNALAMPEQDCYAAISPAWIDGSNPLIVQVVPGSVATEGGGAGYQDGGALRRRQSFQVVIWKRLKTMAHQMSEEVMVEEVDGLLDLSERIRAALALTYLEYPAGTFLLTEPVQYDGESDISAFDWDAGIFTKTIQISCVWVVARPRAVTMRTADVAA